jgi:hypothetical protein
MIEFGGSFIGSITVLQRAVLVHIGTLLIEKLPIKVPIMMKK